MLDETKARRMLTQEVAFYLGILEERSGYTAPIDEDDMQAMSLRELRRYRDELRDIARTPYKS
jgi:hypothetical protein